MINPNTNNPDANGAREPSEDPSGFIPSTYRAAEGDTDEANPLIEEPKQKDAYLHFTKGGELSQLSFEDDEPRDRSYPRTRHGGGKRGPVRGASRASLRNLGRRLAPINRHAFRASRGRVFSVTLTYPHAWPDAQTCKRHLRAFHKRLRRMFGEDFAWFWRLGIQARGAWHFHVLFFIPSSPGLLDGLRRFASRAWWEICGKISEGHLRAGSSVQELRTWRRVRAYRRYMAKPESFPEGVVTGRIWGAWNEDLLPVNWETVRVSREDAYKIRRVFRRLARLQATGTLRRITVFIRHENVLRLLDFLGYRHE